MCHLQRIFLWHRLHGFDFQLHAHQYHRNIVTRIMRKASITVIVISPHRARPSLYPFGYGWHIPNSSIPMPRLRRVEKPYCHDNSEKCQQQQCQGGCGTLCECSKGKLDKPDGTEGFLKTREVKPGESERLAMTFTTIMTLLLMTWQPIRG